MWAFARASASALPWLSERIVTLDSPSNPVAMTARRISIINVATNAKPRRGRFGPGFSMRSCREGFKNSMMKFTVGLFRVSQRNP